MQSNINTVFGKAKRRKEAIYEQANQLFPNLKQTARNSQPTKSRLFSILKEADITKNKKQKPDQNSKASKASTSRATANDPAHMQGHSFAHRSAGRPNPTTQTNRKNTQQYAAASEQQTPRQDVRQFKSANRLTGLFSSVAERSADAEAAWKAFESARKVAAARIQKEKIQDQADRAANLVEEKQRLAKELAEKQAALLKEEILKSRRKEAAAWAAQNEKIKKDRADRKAGFVPDTMWPRENWQGVVFGNDFTAFKRSQRLKEMGMSTEEIREEAFNYGPKNSGEESNTKPNRFPNTFKRPSATAAPPPKKKTRAEQKRQRDFDEEDPDDCWGYNGNYNTANVPSPPHRSAGTPPAYRWAEAPPSDYPSGYGSPYASPSYGGHEEEEEEGYGTDSYDMRDENGYYDKGHDGYDNYADDSYNEENDYDGYDDGYFGASFFQGEEWENFKSSWYGHSREHHHDYYYNNFGTDGYTGTNGRGGRGGATSTGAGAGSTRGQTGAAVCKESAVREVKRAIQAATSNATAPTAAQGTSVGAEIGRDEARMLEIESALASAAEHSGNDIAAFAAALDIHVDNSKGQEHAKKMAKKGILMAFHPDKLARAGALEQFLGQCVTRLILSSVK